MNILLIGNNGQLGWELQRSLAPLGQLTALDYPELDLGKPQAARKQVLAIQPEVIVNAAAYTAVDEAETESALAFLINRDSPGVLAEVAQELRAVFIHYSTDYVFDGKKGSPYQENDVPNPLNVYGQSKLEGERAVEAVGGAYLIFRTSWVYSLRRPSFVTKVLEWSRHQQVLRIVADQVSGPTWARMLAEVSAQVLAKGSEQIYPWIQKRARVYHLAGSGYGSRLEWAQAVLELDPHKEQQVTEILEPAKTSEFPAPAERPLFSALNTNLFAETFGIQLPVWQQALAMAMDRA